MSKIFDPNAFHVIVGGNKMQGFSSDTMAKFEFDEEATLEEVGVDGECSRSLNMNRMAKLTISLMQTSDSNDILSAMYAAQRLSSNGNDIVACRIEDSNGRLVVTGPECWVKDLPKPTWGKSAKEYEWVIRIANGEAFFGGSD
jgi:hypothetical protein